MADTSEGTPRERLRWLQNNVLVSLTILGVLLYAVFSIPATFFYARLGTTPSEVGYTYASILSGSTLGALLILGSILFAAFYIVNLVVPLVIYYYGFRIIFNYLRNPDLLFHYDWELNTEDFERKLAMIKKQYRKDQEAWRELEPALRSRRRLRQLQSPSSKEKSEIKKLHSKVFRLRVRPAVSLLGRMLRPRSWYIYVLFLLLVVSTVVLTLIAQGQASEVIAGRAEITGSQLGLFDYHVVPVKIEPSGSGNDQSIQRLAGKQMYLLGQNGQYIIIYVPQQRWTIRIPATTVIVTSSP